MLPLDYETSTEHGRLRFRFGIASLALSIAAAIITLIIGFATNRTHISPFEINDGLQLMLATSIAGFCTGIPGLFYRRGRRIAIAGVVLSVLDFLLILAFMVA